RTLAAAGLAAMVCSGALAQQNLGASYRDAGRDAYRDKQYAQATKYLRLARFLSLDDPKLYLEVVARLAVAEDGAKAADARDRTLDRFYEVESRFGDYDAASLEPDVRQDFSALVQHRYSHEQLMDVPTLAAELGLIATRPARVPTKAAPPPAPAPQ